MSRWDIYGCDDHFAMTLESFWGHFWMKDGSLCGDFGRSYWEDALGRRWGPFMGCHVMMKSCFKCIFQCKPRDRKHLTQRDTLLRYRGLKNLNFIISGKFRRRN